MAAVLVVLATYVITFIAGVYSRVAVNIIRKHGGWVDPRDYPKVRYIQRPQHEQEVWKVGTIEGEVIHAVDLEKAMKASEKSQ